MIDTKTEVCNMIKGGMVAIDSITLKMMLNKLGYTINKDNSFNYCNTGNGNSYKAKSVAIHEYKSNKCFSNLDSDKTNLKELQAIRGTYFVYEADRIWEL